MQYYIIEHDKDYTDSIEIVNWFGKIDVEKMVPEKYIELEDLYVLEVKGNELLDIICYPFFLVSKMAKYCIRAYEPNIEFTSVALWNKQQKEVYEYYIPHLDKVKILSDKSKFKYNTTYVENPLLNKKVSIDKYIFSMADLEKKHIVLKKELAESMLKRGVRGIRFIGIEEEK